MRGKSGKEGQARRQAGEPGRVTGSQGERMREREERGGGDVEQVKNDDEGKRERGSEREKDRAQMKREKREKRKEGDEEWVGE